MLLGNIGDHPHFFLGQHHAGGVAGVCDHNGPGILGYQALDALAVGIAVALLRSGGQRTDAAAGSVNEGGVVGIIGLRNDDLRIGIQNAQAGQQQRLAAAGGDQNIVRLQIYTDLAVILADRVDQHRHTGGCFVRQRAGVKGADGVKISFRCL